MENNLTQSKEPANAGSLARLVRLHFFGDNLNGRIEIPERTALMVIQSAADHRLAALLDLICEHESEENDNEKYNIRRTIVEILENSTVLPNDPHQARRAEGDELAG